MSQIKIKFIEYPKKSECFINYWVGNTFKAFAEMMEFKEREYQLLDVYAYDRPLEDD